MASESKAGDADEVNKAPTSDGLETPIAKALRESAEVDLERMVSYQGGIVGYHKQVRRNRPFLWLSTHDSMRVPRSVHPRTRTVFEPPHPDFLPVEIFVHHYSFFDITVATKKRKRSTIL